MTTYVVDAVERANVDHVCEEDQLDLGERGADLVISIGALDTVSDLPGALILMRRTLRPGGRLLVAFFGGPSLTTMREIVTEANAATGFAAARLHPQIDVRGGGDLLARSGYVRPVADLHELHLRYRRFDRALADLRDSGGTNCLAQRHAVSRSWLDGARTAFARKCETEDGVNETVGYVTLSGFRPNA